MMASEILSAVSKKLPPTRQVLRHFEENAIRIREQAGIGPEEPIDPIESASAFGALTKVAENEYDARAWSGSARPLPNGQLFVMLNANQTRQRMNVTFLEEIAHHHYGHHASSLDANGRPTYDEANEQEAYWTAAAVLLPSVAVARAVRRGEAIEEIGRRYGASEELVKMRIGTLGLWNRHVENDGSPRA